MYVKSRLNVLLLNSDNDSESLNCTDDQGKAIISIAVVCSVRKILTFYPLHFCLSVNLPEITMDVDFYLNCSPGPVGY